MLRTPRSNDRSLPGFRMRGGKITRLASFSDAVFGFALTLLVVSLDVPRTFEDLIGTTRGFPAFAVCFLFLSRPHLEWPLQILPSLRARRRHRALPHSSNISLRANAGGNSFKFSATDFADSLASRICETARVICEWKTSHSDFLQLQLRGLSGGSPTFRRPLICGTFAA